MRREVQRSGNIAMRLAGLLLAWTLLTLPAVAQAEWFWEEWFRSEAAPAVKRPGNGLAVYDYTPRSWAHLPAIVYASVPTIEGRYPVQAQHALSGMPVQTVPVRPVVVQSRPHDVYGGGEQ
ncbi:hypothetical protein [Candidatus Magnetaquicoccus inordinatus]|uniref:hypothetical protein n=1 Tax=Candidatus Magnetaquicoccus inordinatus TaxID=2496818 RepID=UPI00102B17AD|nr:hypothetical protein [Candidatus Magnetaquicoccus inordinatus]